MKNRIAAAVAAMAIGAVSASAYDVKVDGIYYNIIDGEYLEVTAIVDYNIDYSSEYRGVAPKSAKLTPNDYAGDIVIPELVDVDGFDDPLPVRSIRQGAFNNAHNLVSVKLPFSIRQIGTGAFAESSIRMLDMSNANLVAIPDWLCYLCGDLKVVELPSGITEIGDGAFSISGIRKLKIPDSVKSIGTQAFSRCEDLREIEGGQSVEEFYIYSFDGTNIGTVFIYDAATTFSGTVYGNNKSLQNVICYKSEPDNFWSSYSMDWVFYGSNPNCTLWVPDESLELYKASERWTSFFTDIRPLSQSGIESAVAADDEAAPALFDLLGCRVTAPVQGRIYVGSDGRKVRY